MCNKYCLVIFSFILLASSQDSKDDQWSQFDLPQNIKDFIGYFNLEKPFKASCHNLDNFSSDPVMKNILPSKEARSDFYDLNQLNDYSDLNDVNVPSDLLEK